MSGSARHTCSTHSPLLKGNGSRGEASGPSASVHECARLRVAGRGCESRSHNTQPGLYPACYSSQGPWPAPARPCLELCAALSQKRSALVLWAGAPGSTSFPHCRHPSAVQVWPAAGSHLGRCTAHTAVKMRAWSPSCHAGHGSCGMLYSLS